MASSASTHTCDDNVPDNSPLNHVVPISGHPQGHMLNNSSLVSCKNKLRATQQLGCKFCLCIHVSARPTGVKGGWLLRLCSPHLCQNEALLVPLSLGMVSGC